MPRLDSKFTPRPIAIGILSLTLLALSITVVTLEARVQDAFQDKGRQYPGSSIAEFLFVPLNPSNIDEGPTVVKFAVGACSMAVSLLGIAWAVLHWCKAYGTASMIHVRMMGSAACIAAVTNTAAAVGITVYLFTTEAQGHLPKFFSQWGGASFTQEFYLCEAVPSVFPDARAMYGFPACEEARAGRFLLLAICCVSAVLAGLSVVQAHRDGVFAVFMKTRKRGPLDVEQGRPRRTTKGKSPQQPAPQQPDMVHIPSSSPLPTPDKLQNLPAWQSQPRTSLYGYYAK